MSDSEQEDMTMLDETQAQSEEVDTHSEHDSHDNLSDAVESTPNAGSSAKPSSPKVLNTSSHSIDEEEDDINEVSLRTPSKAQPVVATDGPYVYKSSLVAKRIAESRVTKRFERGMNILEDDYPTGPDTLTWRARDTYERTKMKIALSIIYSGFFLLVLGLAAVSGGNGERYLDLHWALEADGGHDSIVAYMENETQVMVGDQLGILTRGHGFACFCHLVACALILVAAIRMSPFFCGANGEASRVTKFFAWDRRRPDGRYEKIVKKADGTSVKLSSHEHEAV